MRKIGLFNTFVDNGGAAIATLRIKNSIDSSKFNLQLFVLNNKRFYTNDTIVLKFLKFFNLSTLLNLFDKLFLIKYTNRKRQIFSNSRALNLISKTTKNYNLDIVHLFWVSGGLLNISDLNLIQKPIIWTLHDMYPMTGGCHYDEECNKFKSHCGNCPILNSNNKFDLSFINLSLKIKHWKNLDFHIVGTSKWISDQASQSTIFKNFPVYTIANPIDTDLFKPFDKTYAKNFFNFSNKKLHILFSAHGALSDKRKGVKLLIDAINLLDEKNELKNVELTILGSHIHHNKIATRCKINHIPFIANEHSRILLYSASDILIAPSLQENLSNTVMEALSCGLPVIAFKVGGMSDLIVNYENGILVEKIDFNLLSEQIQFSLINSIWRKNASLFARRYVINNFSKNIIGAQYENLYKKVLLA